MQSSLQRYFALRIKNLFNHLHDFELTGAEAPLHDFRVELKKLKAIIKFLKSVYPKHKFKSITYVMGSVFKDAGEIREYQLLTQWIQQHELQYLEECYFPPSRMQEMIRTFTIQSRNYKSGLKEVSERCENYIHSTNKILPEQYLTGLNAKIDKMLHKPIPTSDWHELRKLIKQWMYATNWVSPEAENKNDSFYSYYNRLQEQIGLWHDVIMIRDTLQLKQIHLSPELDIQRDLNKAREKINQSLRYRERLVTDMLAHPQDVVSLG